MRAERAPQTASFKVEELTDFALCPYRWKLKYVEGVKEGARPVDKSFESAAEKVLRQLAYEMLDGALPSREEFRNRFGSVWYAGMKREDFLFKDFSKVERLSVTAVKALDELYDQMTSISGVLVGVDVPFDVAVLDRVGHNGIPGVKGRFPIIVKEGAEYLVYALRPGRAPGVPPSADYETIALSFAFRAKYRRVEKSLVVIDLGGRGLIPLAFGRKHYLQLRDLVELMSYAKGHGCPPTPGHHCEECGYRKICW